MAYDALAESLRLIDGGPLAGAERLTRRRRFLAVAVDVDADIAVTVFLRRAHGGAEWQTHVLRRASTGWRLLGGGGWGVDELDTLSRVPTAADLGGPAVVDGSGGTAAGPDEAIPGSDRWLSHAVIRTTADVDRVIVGGSRTIARPSHGYIAVVWEATGPLPVTVIGVDGQRLCTLQLRR